MKRKVASVAALISSWADLALRLVSDGVLASGIGFKVWGGLGMLGASAGLCLTVVRGAGCQSAPFAPREVRATACNTATANIRRDR